ncbi:MAG TPA: YetF domain-containing protein [Pyrinomonadaceae bacterium]|nr:YetF domain-containing protein [Pyrinomonadaceae bacterium]
MDWIFNIDWRSMFVPSESILEVIIRGTIMYLGMYAVLRVFRRQSGSVGIADLLVIVVIADAAQNGMAGDSRSITEALTLIVTIVLWDWFLDWLGFKSPLFDRILSPQALLLIENGRMIKKNLDREFITEEELLSQLREQGVGDITAVKKCFLESNGHFSVLTESSNAHKKGGNAGDAVGSQ